MRFGVDEDGDGATDVLGDAASEGGADVGATAGGGGRVSMYADSFKAGL